MKKKPSLAIWPDKFLEPLVAELSKPTSGFNVVVTDRERCEQLALAGMVDVSLISSIPVFLHEEDLDIYSAAAISSWKFPFAVLHSSVRIGEKIDRVEYKPEDRWYATVAKIILNEHYHLQPRFVESAAPSLDEAGGAIVKSTDGTERNTDAAITSYDLGEEWFELTGYPMVWGLFACSKGTLLQRTNDALREAVAAFKVAKDGDGISASEEDVLSFYSEDIRVGYDDLATASLTELSQYLFFYNIVDQPVAVPVIAGNDE